MLLSNREEQLLKLFKKYGELSVEEISRFLQVSTRTVYRVLASLEKELQIQNISLAKNSNRYFIEGNIDSFYNVVNVQHFTRTQRLACITYELLISDVETTNETLQNKFLVSNVTIIQDIQDIENRIKDFGMVLERKRGYKIKTTNYDSRRMIANIITNSLSLSDFQKYNYGYFNILEGNFTKIVVRLFQLYKKELPELDVKMEQFLMIVLSLSNQVNTGLFTTKVSKLALEFSKNFYKVLSQQTEKFFPISEILYFANILDEVLLNRQETPLFQEKFDSEFFYNIANFINKVSTYTKIDFVKDRVLFKFLFYHIRLSLGVPIIFEEPNSLIINQETISQHEHLHRVVCLLIGDIFPRYLRRESEYTLITLHFAASLRRSPDIYPIHILLISNDRPLSREILISRLKTIAPFIKSITVVSQLEYESIDKTQFNGILSTRLLGDKDVKVISIYPDPKELVDLQHFLQNLQMTCSVRSFQIQNKEVKFDFKNYIECSEVLLERFRLIKLENSINFKDTVIDVIDHVPNLSDKTYLVEKLLNRFALSPMGIPDTGLVLLHTHSKKVSQSCFKIFELSNSLRVQSMNRQNENVSRILLMLSNIDESNEIKDLMTVISQSIIENHLYTEIYKTGNEKIIYQLLSQIFTERIKKLEE